METLVKYMINTDKKNNNLTLKTIFIFSVLLILFINLIKSWVKLNERLDFIKNAKIKLVKEQKKQIDLKREFARSQTSEFVEKQARDKLNLSRDGELIILLPTPVLTLSPTPTPIDTAANWQKWVRIFL